MTEGYCVVATRGGELPEVNCQSVTQIMHAMTKVNSIRPADGTSLRALSEVRPATPASIGRCPAHGGTGEPGRYDRVLRANVNDRKAAGPSEGGWRQNGRKRKHIKQGDLPGPERCSWPPGPKSRPAGVRASVVARKRVTSVEPRDAGKWKREGHDH